MDNNLPYVFSYTDMIEVNEISGFVNDGGSLTD
jgi:hypothetical protein